MAQPSGRLGLPAEALDELLVARELPMDDLDGDGAGRPQVRRLVDGSHPSLPEQQLDQVLVVEPFSAEEVVQSTLLLSQPRLFRPPFKKTLSQRSPFQRELIDRRADIGPKLTAGKGRIPDLLN